MQKLNCILKVCFKNDERTPRAENIKTFLTIEAKWGVRNCFQARIPTLCSHIEKIRESILKIHVQRSNTLKFF